MHITVFGTTFVDIKGYPIDTFIPNGRNAGYIRHIHGGVGRNVAEDLAHLGLSSSLLSLTDGSALSLEVLNRLKKSGVNTDFVTASDCGMGTWMAIFDDKGDVAANISVRPQMAPLADVIREHHREIFENTNSIIVEIDMDAQVVDCIFEYGQLYQKKIFALVSNMGIALERREHFPKTTCFICNLQEAEMLLEEPLESLSVEEIQKKVLKACQEQAFQRLIVTLGERGAVFAASNGESGFCPAEKVLLKDSTGAGDAFCAGASAALTLGKDLKTACAAGSKTAAAVITVTDNVCPVMDLQELK